MNKKAISSVELAALVNELQFLVKGKVSQIYHQEKKELLLQLHAVGRGKQLLKIVVGKWLCLTQEKNAPTNPSGFCMQLRKHLGNAFIKDVRQYNSERIVVFEFEKKEKFLLVVELFSKGNIVLVDEKLKIINCLQWQKWKDRTVKPGEVYMFPDSRVNWKELKEKKLFDILQASEKKNLATSLATEIGLGGVYAEEVCLRAGVDKSLKPVDVSKADSKKLFGSLKELIGLLEDSHGFVYDDQMTPFELHGQEKISKFESYNEAIDTLKIIEKASPYEKKIGRIKRTIESQRETILRFEEKINLNTLKGEKVYEQYAPLQKLLEIVSEMKRSKTWVEVGEELKKNKKISSVNLKKKTVVIDL